MHVMASFARTGAVLFALASGIALPAAAQTENWPDRPMRLVLGYAAGGTTDIVARVVAESMSHQFGQQVVVENRGGAGGVPAALNVLQSPADGNTLILHAGGLNQAEALGTPLPFDAVNAWAPVGLVGTSAIALVVHPSVPATNLRELQAFARASPHPLRFGSPGVSLTSAQYGQAMGVEFEEIRYRGTGQVVADLVAGRLQGYTIALPGILQFVRSGELRAIAIASTTRSHVMPQLATTVEQGFPDIISASWFGVATRAGTPPDRLAKLGAAVNVMLRDQAMRSRLTEAGLDVATETSPESFDRLVRDDRAMWETVVRRGNLRQ